MAKFDKRLKGILTKAGLVEGEKVDAALEEAASQEKPLSQVLVEQELVSERDLIGSVAKEMNIPPIDLAKTDVTTETLESLAQDLAEYYGVVPCTIMSMMSNKLMPSACETDIAGAIGMYAMALASGKPSALADWNNNYGGDPNKGVLFHCSNLPKDFFEETPDMDYQAIIAGTVGQANTYGTVVGRVKAAPFTYVRISTDDWEGKIRAYLGEGRLTKDPLQTFGGYGVFEIPNLQKLLHYICENGFEHHVAVNISQVADAVHEALGKYLGWDVYYHKG